jgi:hypothetical protein
VIHPGWVGRGYGDDSTQSTAPAGAESGHWAATLYFTTNVVMILKSCYKQISLSVMEDFGPYPARSEDSRTNYTQYPEIFNKIIYN